MSISCLPMHACLPTSKIFGPLPHCSLSRLLVGFSKKSWLLIQLIRAFIVLEVKKILYFHQKIFWITLLIHIHTIISRVPGPPYGQITFKADIFSQFTSIFLFRPASRISQANFLFA